MRSRHQRWLEDTITDQAWDQCSDWRKIFITRSALYAELESEVAAVIGPVLVEWRERHSMWEIAASVTDTDGEQPDRALKMIGCVRLYLFWMIDTYAQHTTDQAVIDACNPALTCGDGRLDYSGSCYDCEEFAESFHSGHRPLSDLAPSEEAAEAICRSLAGAYRRAAEAGYTPDDLAMLTAREQIERRDPTVRGMFTRLAQVEPALALADQ